MKKKLNGYYNYTVVLTYLGMLSGFVGICGVVRGAHAVAVLCLMIAGFCDMFDGAVAATRPRTENEKRFGIQIDSLSDLICFGVLPASIVYGLCGRTLPALIVGGVYTLCALIRLAYFNVMEEERQSREDGRRVSYDGLPVTASAVLLPLLYLANLWMEKGKVAFLLSALFLIAFAFVFPFRVRKPHRVGKVIMILIGAAEFALLLLNMKHCL